MIRRHRRASMHASSTQAHGEEAKGMMQSTISRAPEADLERARGDYLSVSRNGHLYASESEHLRAERIAWERLERTLAAVRDATRGRA